MNSKIIISVIFFFLSYSSSKAQNTNTFNHPLKVEKVNDSMYAVGRYESTQRQGQWIFYKYGIVKKIVNYRNDTLSGKGYYFNTLGTMIRESDFKNGKLNGLVKFYASDGELIAIYEYSNSIKGITKYYKLHPERPPKGHNYRPEY